MSTYLKIPIAKVPSFDGCVGRRLREHAQLHELTYWIIEDSCTPPSLHASCILICMSPMSCETESVKRMSRPWLGFKYQETDHSSKTAKLQSRSVAIIAVIVSKTWAEYRAVCLAALVYVLVLQGDSLLNAASLLQNTSLSLLTRTTITSKSSCGLEFEKDAIKETRLNLHKQDPKGKASRVRSYNE